MYVGVAVRHKQRCREHTVIVRVLLDTTVKPPLDHLQVKLNTEREIQMKIKCTGEKQPKTQAQQQVSDSFKVSVAKCAISVLVFNKPG